MDPKVQNLLDGTLELGELSRKELEALQNTIAREFSKLDKQENTPAGDVETLEKLSEAHQAVSAQINAIDEEQAATAERVSELRGRIAPVRAEREHTENPDATGDGPVGPDDPGEVAPSGPTVRPSEVERPFDPARVAPEQPEAPAEEQTDEAVAASTRTPSRAALAARTRPVARTTARRPALVAGGALVAASDMPGIGLGTQVGWDELSRSMSRRLDMFGGGTGEQVLCASLLSEYPDERKLTDDPWLNEKKLNEQLSVDRLMDTVNTVGYDALVAAGGICEPVPVDYNIPIDSTVERPVKSALPSWQATRGGLRFIQPLTLAGVQGGTPFGTAIWTAANDANPTSPSTKPVQTFACGSTVEELVDAIPTRLQFSNMQARFSPEIVAANTQLSLVAAARVQELNLLSKISARSTIIGAPGLLSFTRDFFALLELLAQGYRYRNRLPDMFPLRVMLPAWFKGAVRTDLLRELAHDRDSTDSDNLRVADSYVSGMFAIRGIVPTYVIDGLPHSTAGTTLGTNAWDWPDQAFGPLTTNSAIAAPVADASAGSSSAGTYWPKRLTFFLYAEGTFVFLDGGRIDLGIVRDSALNATNQYQTFVEPFEGVAKRGYESIQCTVPMNMSGATVGGVTAPTVPAAY